MQVFFKYKRGLVPGALIFFSLLLLTFDSIVEGKSQKAESFFLTLLSPLQGAVTSGWSRLSKLKERVSLDEEKEAILAEVERLRSKVTDLEEQRLENERLRQLLAFKERKSFEDILSGSLGARVIGREPTNWYRTIVIDKGRSDGVERGLPVISYQGIVGYVSQVWDNASQVRLILDGDSSVGALVQRSRVSGVVKGKGTDICEMVYISPQADIVEGDLIISSGFGGKYPSGLRIGTVVEVKRESYLQRAWVLPTVDFSRLEEVLVIIQP
ncbi:rod shape-determining protein MreC [candidate division NPL-UPA2 bacterium]|nr:rod shape-determining protein MreC [candidate division NPL-UPA2 bacterium]